MERIVLESLQSVTAYAREHEERFVKQLLAKNSDTAEKHAALKKKELVQLKQRYSELDRLFQKVYEDHATNLLSDERYAKLSEAYDSEQKTVSVRISVIEQELSEDSEQIDGVQKFMKAVRRYTDIQELTYENLREFIEKIYVYEKDKTTNEQRIDIHYNFIGMMEKVKGSGGSLHIVPYVSLFEDNVIGKLSD